MDADKKQQIINIIATAIVKLPANTIMDHGTVGHDLKKTKREGEAESMARYVLPRLGYPIPKVNIEGKYTEEEKAIWALLREITNSAIEIAGK